VDEAGVGKGGARAVRFIGAWGGEGGERWRAPVSLPRRGWWRTVVATGWLGQTGRRDGSGRRKAPNRAGECDNGEATGRAVAGGDRVSNPVTGARKALTCGTRLLGRERETARERGGVRLTGGVGLAAAEGSAGARAMGRLGREGEREVRARVRGGGFGPETAHPRGACFLFFFF
jgi:hypothetical protein